MAKFIVCIEAFRVFDTKSLDKHRMRRNRLSSAQPAHGVSTNSWEQSTATIRSALSRNDTPICRFIVSSPLTER